MITFKNKLLEDQVTTVEEEDFKSRFFISSRITGNLANGIFKIKSIKCDEQFEESLILSRNLINQNIEFVD